jgi:adenylyl-sulfate kinase
VTQRRGKGVTVWFTGLSGAGKSTISTALAGELRDRGVAVEILDGDIIRENLSKGLGFSKEDRDTNIRRIGFVAELLTRHGVVVLVAAISPYREIRDEVHAKIGNFVEVFVRCSIPALVDRDVKGLYKKALAGEIAHFTGVSDPYEEPLHADLVIDTDSGEDVETSMTRVLDALVAGGHIAGDARAAIA